MQAYLLYLVSLFFALGMILSPTLAAAMTFGLAGKSVDDVNFVDTWRGCSHEALKNGDTCHLIGKSGAYHFRYQDAAISEAFTRPLDGIAVSVLHSQWLATHSLSEASRKSVPLITFDSDLDATHAYLRQAYVGPDNIALGRELGRVAKRLRPQGGKVWIMSGAPTDPNVNERVAGVRQVLGNNQQLAGNGKITRDSPWSEHVRSPWFNDNNEQRALLQLQTSFLDSSFDILILVGDWPLRDVNGYRRIITQFKAGLKDSHELVIIMATGVMTPEKSKLLEDGLVQAYVSIDFTEIGRLVYKKLKMLAMKEQPPALTLVKTTTVYAGERERGKDGAR